jgi:hypothetical protein
MLHNQDSKSKGETSRCKSKMHLKTKRKARNVAFPLCLVSKLSSQLSCE